MEKITTQQLKSGLIAASYEIIKAEPYLTEIDTIIGDGDHGTGMMNGFTALVEYLNQQEYSTPYDLLYSSGICLVKTMGGASGVLFGTLLIGGLDEIKGKTELTATQLAGFFDESTKAVQARGRTQAGDKTMVDALLAAVEQMNMNINSGEPTLQSVLNAAYKGALAGVEATKNMLPKKGRSKNFREQAIGYPDPGAISVSLFFKGLQIGILKSEEINYGI